MHKLYRDHPMVILYLILGNLLLSAWCIHIDPVINNDGVTYLAMAQQILQGQWAAPFDHYSWPYYSFFIAALAKLLFIDVEPAAYLLNTIFATSLTLAFVSVVSELSNSNRKIVLIAALVILLFPSINKYRAFIIRDFGYLSCYLWSMYFMFLYCKTFKKINLVYWLILAVLSWAFRFEGVVFILSAPYFLLLLLARKAPHRQKLITLLSAILVTSSVALIGWYLNDKYTSLIEAAKINGEDINGITDLFFNNMENRLHGKPLTFVTFIQAISASAGNVSYELIRRMAIFYFFFSVYAYYKQLTLKNPFKKRMWQVYVVTNLVVLVGFSLYNNFLVSRYTLATGLTLLLIAPFTINHLLESAHTSLIKKGGVVVVAILLLGISVDRLTPKNHNLILKEAGTWLSENISDDATVYSNSKLVVYYADRGAEKNLDRIYNFQTLISQLRTNQVQTYDYVALTGDLSEKHHNIARQTLAYHFGRFIKKFDDDNGHSILIFQNRALR